MGKHLVFVGAGHAHIAALVNLRDYGDRGHRVTVVSPSPYHYYSSMGPGMLGGTYSEHEARFHVRKLVEERGGVFVQAEVTRVDPEERRLVLSTGDDLSYDIASFSTGSRVPSEAIVDGREETVFDAKPVVNLLRARAAILEAVKKGPLRIAVIGGGPTGVELCGNAHKVVAESGGRAEITLIARGPLLSGLPARARELAAASLRQREMLIMENSVVEHVRGGEVLLKGGGALRCDIAFLALGVTPSPVFEGSTILVAKGGGMLVNRYLQSVKYPRLFGGGDCICFEDRPLAKVGVYAVRESSILRHNLRVALEGGVLKTFRPQRAFLLILNMGDGKGVLMWKGWTWHGRSAFRLKDYLDRSFMGKFQVCGERTEEANGE